MKFDDKRFSKYKCYKIIFKWFVKSVGVDLLPGHWDISWKNPRAGNANWPPTDGRRIKEATRIPGSSSVPSAHLAVSGFSWGCVAFFQQSSFLSPSQQIPQADPGTTSARPQSSDQYQTKQFSGQITRWALISWCDHLLRLTDCAYERWSFEKEIE